MQPSADLFSVYVHVPYCERACSYCDFYFTTHPHSQPGFTEALLAEITGTYFNAINKGTVRSLYFGGGTPTRMPVKFWETITEALNRRFDFEKGFEFTVEANPNDLTPEMLRTLRSAGVNRLSIGIQSFFEEELRLMNRSHSAAQAETCIPSAQDAGFTNLSIDLIYHTPTLTEKKWEQTLYRALKWKVSHISAYALTIEPRTALEYQIKTGKILPADDEQFRIQARMLHDTLLAEGLEDYEISNFARPGFRSQHNSGYWDGYPYLGLGPSAHSFDGTARYANEANIHFYINRLLHGNGTPPEREILSAVDAFNERLMTRLRLKEGIEPDFLDFFPEKERIRKLEHIHSLIEQKLISRHPNGNYFLTFDGKMVANRVIELLMAE